jgi:hypothetical protein
MRFFQAIGTIILFFHPFLCIGMNNTPLTEEKIQALIVEPCRRRKTQLSPESFQKIQTYSLEELKKQVPEHSLLKNRNSPQKTTCVIQKTTSAVEKKEVPQLKNDINQQLSRKPKASPITTTTIPKKKFQQNEDENPTKKAHWRAFQLLLQKYDVNHRRVLIPILGELCNDIWQKKALNNITNGPYFNEQCHLLFVSISKHWSTIFSPCKRAFATTNHPYSDVVNNFLMIPEYLGCTNNCPFYSLHKIKLHTELDSD